MSDLGQSGEGDESAWVERHRGQVVAVALAVCLLAPVGRVLTG